MSLSRNDVLCTYHRKVTSKSVCVCWRPISSESAAPSSVLSVCPRARKYYQHARTRVVRARSLGCSSLPRLEAPSRVLLCLALRIPPIACLESREIVITASSYHAHKVTNGGTGARWKKDRRAHRHETEIRCAALPPPLPVSLSGLRRAGPEEKAEHPPLALLVPLTLPPSHIAHVRICRATIHHRAAHSDFDSFDTSNP
eukprot:5650493-Prymnesium_polylepis.1